MHRSFLPAALLLLLFAPSAFGAEHKASSAADLSRIAAQPGDEVILSDGHWINQHLVFRGKGTAEKPIVFRPKTSGKLLMTGKSSIVIDGEHLVVSGLLVKDAGLPTGDTIEIKGKNNRLTDTAIIACAHKFFVHLRGSDHRVDHCYLADKTNDDPTLQVEVEAQPNRHRIDHNHFGHRPPLGRNGGETIRVGYSHQSMSSSGTIVEHNLFDRCDGEIEIISSKSCDNIYRHNTFLDCAGMLTLRHGNRCVIDSNFFIGRHKKGSGGIRIIGEEHIITNNYIEGVEKGGFWITSGIVDSELKGYFQSKNCLIAFNTFVDSPGPAVEVDAGIGTSRRTLRPANITIANNLFAPTKGLIIKGTEGKGFKWLGNMADSRTASGPAPAGILLTDLRLIHEAGEFWRPGLKSPAYHGAKGDFPSIRMDIEGQKRVSPMTVGCDEGSDEPILHRPLTTGDVGPKWMDAQERSAGSPPLSKQ